MLIVNGSFADKTLTGVQRYAYEMLLALRNLGIPFRIAAPAAIAIPDYAALNDCVDLVPRTALGKALRWEQGDLARYMRGRGELLWNPSNLAIYGVRRQITTVHDLAVYRDASWFDWKFAALYKLYTPFTVRASERVLTVSATVKAEIVERFGVPGEKVVVAYDGFRKPPQAAPLAPERPYLIILGSLDPRKNLANALAGWRALATSTRGPVQLYVVGGSNWRLAFRAGEAEEDPSVRFLGRVDDAELASLMDGCLGSVYLSRYEGFGLPVLEALARDKPCLISDIPVFRELFGEGCRFAHPENVAEIAAGLALLLESAVENRGQATFAAGYTSKYSWDSAARILAGLIS